MESAIGGVAVAGRLLSESKLPKAQALGKMALALARTGRWAEFAEVEQTIRDGSPPRRWKSAANSQHGRRADRQARGHAARGRANHEKPWPDDFELARRQPADLAVQFQSKADPQNANPALFARGV